ncbi:unnamed protein product [Amoebophrya sp. A120]|nr:unnamed protein product [Amoebophrya sp. A120]|eukprot:GSA120T00018929001.1
MVAGARLQGVPANTQSTQPMPPASSQLSDVLDEGALRKVVKRAVQTGVLCPKTLNPQPMQKYDLQKHGVFELPQGMLSKPEFLAEGGFGTVARAQVLPGGKNPSLATYDCVAVKRIKITKSADDWEDTLRLLREVHFLKYLRHPNISPLLHLYTDGTDASKFDYVYLVMPCYRPGSLDEFAVNEISMVRRICAGILRALDWMHQHEVLHRDVKRENIFFDRNKREAVLADMGMARSMVNKMTTKRGVGTRCYLAPEMLAAVEDYDAKVDVFGLGCVLFELVGLSHEHSLIPMSIAGTLDHRARLYGLAGKGCKAEPEVIEKSKKNQKWCENRWRALRARAGNHVEAISEIVLHSLAYDPKKRWTAEQLLQHEWFGEEDSQCPSQVSQSEVEEEYPVDVNTKAFEAYDLALRELDHDTARLLKIREWMLDLVADRPVPLPSGIRNPLEKSVAAKQVHATVKILEAARNGAASASSCATTTPRGSSTQQAKKLLHKTVAPNPASCSFPSNTVVASTTSTSQMINPEENMLLNPGNALTSKQKQYPRLFGDQQSNTGGSFANASANINNLKSPACTRNPNPSTATRWPSRAANAPPTSSASSSFIHSARTAAAAKNVDSQPGTTAMLQQRLAFQDDDFSRTTTVSNCHPNYNINAASSAGNNLKRGRLELHEPEQGCLMSGKRLATNTRAEVAFTNSCSFFPAQDDASQSISSCTTATGGASVSQYPPAATSTRTAGFIFPPPSQDTMNPFGANGMALSADVAAKQRNNNPGFNAAGRARVTKVAPGSAPIDEAIAVAPPKSKKPKK